jgi:hypothetical protein
MADISPLAAEVYVAKENFIAASGQSVVIGLFVRKDDIVGGKQLFDPDDSVKVDIFDPNGVLLLQDCAMTRVAKGKYVYNFKLLHTYALGLYTALFTIADSSGGARIKPVGIVNLRYIGTYPTFSYMAILDQTGGVWYWYVDQAGQIAVSASIPSHVVRVAIDLAQGSPYWIEVVSTDGDTRYILPDTLGQPDFSATQPAVGTGVVGSPVFIGLDAESYTISIDDIDQIFLVRA